MNEKQIILDFLKWYYKDYLSITSPIEYKEAVSQYLSENEPKEDKAEEDWFLHTHWTENIA